MEKVATKLVGLGPSMMQVFRPLPSMVGVDHIVPILRHDHDVVTSRSVLGCVPAFARCSLLEAVR